MKMSRLIKKLGIIILLLLMIFITINSAFSINYDYWRENSTTIWIKVNLTAGQTITLNISNQSGYAPNGDNVFELFDDFDDGDYTNKWVVESGNWVESGGYLKGNSPTGAWSIIKTSSYQLTNNSFRIKFKANTYLGEDRWSYAIFPKSNTYANSWDPRIQYSLDTLNSPDSNHHLGCFNGGAWVNYSKATSDITDGFHTIEILSSNLYHWIIRVDGTTYFNLNYDYSDINYDNYIRLGTTLSSVNESYDWIFITKYDESANITINCNNNICEITSNETLTNYQIPLTTTYTTGNLNINENRYNNYNISFAEYVDKKNVFNEERVPFGLCLADNETKMVITGYTYKKLTIYNLTEKYNISTAVLHQSRLISDMLEGTNAPQIQLPFDVYINNNGTELFVLDEKINVIYHWRLLEPFDLYSSQFIEYLNLSNLTISGELNGVTYSNSIYFSEDGSYFYVDKWNTNKIFQFNLTERWNLTSQQYYNKIQLSSSEYSITLRGFVLSYDGKYLYAFFNGNNFVYQLQMTNNFDITTAIKKYEKNFSSNISNAGKVWITRDGRYLYLTETNTSGYIYQYKISDYTPKTAKISAYSWKSNQYINNFDVKLKSGRIEYYLKNTSDTNIYYEFDKRKWNITISSNFYINKTYLNYNISEKGNLIANLTQAYDIEVEEIPTIYETNPTNFSLIIYYNNNYINNISAFFILNNTLYNSTKIVENYTASLYYNKKITFLVGVVYPLIQNITHITYYWNYTMISSDSLDSLNSVTPIKNLTIEYAYIINNIYTDKNKYIETENVFAIENLTLYSTMANLTTIFQFLGQNYKGIRSENIFYANISTILLNDLNNSDSKNYTLTTILNISFENQTLQRTYNISIPFYKIKILECSSANKSITFKSYDEESTTQINSTINSVFTLWIKENQTKTYSFGKSNIQEVSYCVYPDWAQYHTNIFIDYSAEGYSSREYYVNNALIDYNSNDLVNLYLLNSSKETIVLITVLDQNADPITGAYIKVQRYDVATNTYKTVEIIKTNIEGQALAHLVLYDVWYKFIVDYNEETVLETTAQKLSSATMTLYINTEQAVLTGFEASRKINYNPIEFIEVNNTLGYFKFVYSDTQNIVTEGCLEVIADTYGNPTICKKCEQSPSATLICYVPLEGKYIARALIHTNTKYSWYQIDSIQRTFTSLAEILGQNGLWLQIFVTIAFALLGIWYPITAVVLSLFAFGLLGYIGVGVGSWYIFSSLIVIIIAVMMYKQR